MNIGIVFSEVIILPELFLGVSILYLVLHGTFLSIRKEYPLIQESILYLSVLVILCSSYLVFNEHLNILEASYLNNTFILDYVSFSSKIVIGILSGVCLLMIKTYLVNQKINNFEYLLLILFSVLGLFVLCSSNDFLTAYLAIELQSLSFYVLAAFKKTSTYSVDAGIKYFILGSFASCMLLFGVSLLYGITGTICFDHFNTMFCNVSSGKLIFPTSETESYGLLRSSFLNNISIDVLEAVYSVEIQKSNGACLNSSSVCNNTLFIDQFVRDKGYNGIDTFDGFDNKKELREAVFWSMMEKIVDVNEFLGQTNSYQLIESEIKNFITSDENLIKFALIFILIALFFKLSVAPFHIWAPDVYEGSPTSSAFFFSVVPKLSIFVLLLRIFYYSFYGFVDSWRYFIVLVVVFSILVGSFGGLEQRKLKTLLVYSTISHMGYSLIAFSAGTFESLQLLLSYLIVYSFSGLCIWSIFIVTTLKTTYSQKQNKDLTDLVLLGKSNYMLAIFFTTVLFSVAGFPPMIGFLVKMGIFITAIESAMYFVALISILCSVVGTFYYLRLIKLLYFEKVLVGKLYYPITFQSSVVVTILFFLLLFLFINPTLLFLVSYKFSLLVFL